MDAGRVTLHAGRGLKCASCDTTELKLAARSHLSFFHVIRFGRGANLYLEFLCHECWRTFRPETLEGRLAAARTRLRPST